MTDTTIVKTAFFAAAPKTVWAFLTDKDKLGQWFYPPEADLAEGQDYALMGAQGDGKAVKQCWGTVQRMEPPWLLVYTFTIAPLGGVMTTVTWRLEDVQGGTKLTLSHEGVGAAGAAALGLLAALDAGWDRHLGRLRECCSR